MTRPNISFEAKLRAGIISAIQTISNEDILNHIPEIRAKLFPLAGPAEFSHP
jgi:hypothetical protein